MKPLFPGTILFLLLAFPGCTKNPSPPEKPATANNPANEPAGEAAKNELVVHLDAATQKRIGLQTAPLEAASLSPEVKAYGTVLNVTSLATLVANLTTVRAAAEASTAELQRLRTLASQNNASERALQTAQATAARDQAAVESARLALLADWGRAIATRQDLPKFVESLATLESVLLRLEVPAGVLLPANPQEARVAPAGSEHTFARVEYLGPSPSTDPLFQGNAFFFLLTTNTSHFTPGVSVTGFLNLPGPAQKGVIVPSQAIVRYAALSWLYLQTAQDSFARTPVALDAPVEQGWFVDKGLKPGEKIVIVGAQELLSQETNPGGEE